jgi:hypothetical protein
MVMNYFEITETHHKPNMVCTPRNLYNLSTRESKAGGLTFKAGRSCIETLCQKKKKKRHVTYTATMFQTGIFLFSTFCKPFQASHDLHIRHPRKKSVLPLVFMPCISIPESDFL